MPSFLERKLAGALVPGGHQRSVSAAASVGDGRSPLGCITRAGRREWTRVSEDGEGKLPAAPSYGLCGSAGGLPSQSPNGDSVSAAASVGRWATSHRDVAAPKGGAKYVRYQKLAQSQVSPPPLGALVPSGHRSALDRAGRRECHAFGMTERAP